MKININVINDNIGLQLFDGLYAYRQSISNDYKSDWDIRYTNSIDSTANINILFDYMPTLESPINDYDLVFYCNGGEPIMVSSQVMQKHQQFNHVFFITDSYLERGHELYKKIIFTPHNIMSCVQYWTRKFYPQYFENSKNLKLERKNTIALINGQNRTTRHYFFSLLREQIPELFNNFKFTTVTNTNHSFWETSEDFIFRESLESEYYELWKDQPVQDFKYYTNSVDVGIDKKFGTIPPGYFIMPLYFENSCVVFSETSWQNGELTITEKSLKCFYAGSLPFIIGGSHINKLFNELGFNTAWNLLPKNLQTYDQIIDHKKRYGLKVEAIKWLQNNKDIFNSNEFKDLTNQNLQMLLMANTDTLAVKRLNNLMESYERRHRH